MTKCIQFDKITTRFYDLINHRIVRNIEEEIEREDISKIAITIQQLFQICQIQISDLNLA